MYHVIFFNVFQLAVSIYAIRRGGAPERIVGIALPCAAVATLLLQNSFATRFVGVEAGVMTIDLILLLMLIVLSLFADRFWTLWIASMHAIGTTGHLAKAVGLEHLKLVYAVQTAAWSYPMVLLLLIATRRHVSRISVSGKELDWSRSDPTLHQPIGEPDHEYIHATPARDRSSSRSSRSRSTKR